MSSRPILDAGPGLNFLALHKERLLFSAVGPLSAPACVEEEILRKAQADSRFEAADRVWRKLPEHLMSVLPDDPTLELERAVERISSLPLDERYQRRRTLDDGLLPLQTTGLLDLPAWNRR